MAIQPNTRLAVFVNNIAGSDLQPSTFVEASGGVVAERPMYSNYNGWDGGHDVAGYAR